ncbi:hypothetical protein BTN50_0742 [Candidatus Enterovibrio altilux]|uniref:Uncharacterized protein n=1 Tax=Candidatus Enterovibrio altilux TaxID=1927128 RepID=A0A291B8D7_9GAMM|nr:hypothetical protein BTN50_0742 [Candidatus Enterovibrio luxaltus]
MNSIVKMILFGAILAALMSLAMCIYRNQYFLKHLSHLFKAG